MNAQLLIDAIVRQTTVLIAQLATTGGVRAPIAHLANQVFLDLAEELEAQGVSRKVGADMFGMALRAYLRKIQRLSESSTEHGKSLWEAVYDFLRNRPFVARSEVSARFSGDDETLVRGVLHDLTENGLVFQTGTGAEAVLRAATDDELGQMRKLTDGRADELVWALVYHHGPISEEALATTEALRTANLTAVLERLLREGRILRTVNPGGTLFHASRLLVPLGSELGWEAAVFDHFHAMVRTVCSKLAGNRRSAADDCVGGSTYTYQVWPGHPLENEVRGTLARYRAAQSDLRARVRAYNSGHVEVPSDAYQVVVYGGQHEVSDDETQSERT
jgi:hypothetical protein